MGVTVSPVWRILELMDPASGVVRGSGHGLQLARLRSSPESGVSPAIRHRVVVFLQSGLGNACRIEFGASEAIVL
jgi:hypothetical protein